MSSTSSLPSWIHLHGGADDEGLDEVDELDHEGDATGKVDKEQLFNSDKEEKVSLHYQGSLARKAALTPTILIINLNGASFNPNDKGFCVVGGPQ